MYPKRWPHSCYYKSHKIELRIKLQNYTCICIPYENSFATSGTSHVMCEIESLCMHRTCGCLKPSFVVSKTWKRKCSFLWKRSGQDTKEYRVQAFLFWARTCQHITRMNALPCIYMVLTAKQSACLASEESGHHAHGTGRVCLLLNRENKSMFKQVQTHFHEQAIAHQVHMHQTGLLVPWISCPSWMNHLGQGHKQHDGQHVA